ncbi:HAMP domain-containing sensor histidine kinase [Sphaerisporangium sp. NPDC088356]|uniref:sensor histidine kinase n=1 Tax=Sphaerisporangium sp. NPDC088356 TaxID=3154871 RepID=UPI00341D10CE
MEAVRGWSVRSRFTLFSAVVAALLCTLCATVLMVTIHRLVTGYLTDEVASAGGRVASELEVQGRLPDLLAHGQIRHIQMVGPQGAVVAATDTMRGKPPMAAFTPEGGRRTAHSVVCGGAFPGRECHIVVAHRVYVNGGKWTIYSAAPVIPALVDGRLTALVLGVGVLLTIAISYLGNRIVACTLQPVEAIRSELDEINATCPGRRVPVPESHDEIFQLAESVNHTLGRLQAAMEQQRRLTSDASHDLRSPITAMRAEVEDALMAPEQADVNVLGVAVLSGLDRLQAIVRDLLTIARLEAGMPCARDQVDLSELVTSEMDARHPAKRIDRDLEEAVLVLADRLRLARLITNLVDNAERHADTAITVRVYRARGGGDRRFATGAAVLEVLDDGAGIDPDKRELVFQRFARLDAARSRDSGGTGLGLPIARQIAETTGGTLTIGDSPRGARFVLRLPLAPIALGGPPAPRGDAYG